MLAKIFQVPSQINGLPFGLIVIDSSGSSFENLRTLRIEQANHANVQTKPPTGFAQKKTLEEVMVDNVSKDIFDTKTNWSEPNLDNKK